MLFKTNKSCYLTALTATMLLGVTGVIWYASRPTKKRKCQHQDGWKKSALSVQTATRPHHEIVTETSDSTSESGSQGEDDNEGNSDEAQSNGPGEDKGEDDEGESNQSDREGDEAVETALREMEQHLRDSLREYDENISTKMCYSLVLEKCINEACQFEEEGADLILRLFKEGKVFKPLLEWFGMMTSDEHRAAIRVLVCMIKNLDTLEDTIRYLKPQILRTLQFYITVSPDPNCAYTQVKAQAIWCLAQLFDEGIVREEEDQKPYYGPGRMPSPASVLFRDLANQLAVDWDSFERTSSNKHIQALEIADAEASALRKEGIQPLDERYMFSIIGPDHKPPKIWTQWGMKDGTDTLEHERLAVANRILMSPFGNVLKDMLELHNTFNVDEQVVKSAWRKEMTVGSFHFYEQYRVFLPAEEIPGAMEELVQMVKSEMIKRLHPIAQAYYFYAGLVYFIHPFEDGNGRMGRIMSNSILRRFGYKPALSFSDKAVSFQQYIEKVIFHA